MRSYELGTYRIDDKLVKRYGKPCECSDHMENGYYYKVEAHIDGLTYWECMNCSRLYDRQVRTQKTDITQSQYQAMRKIVNYIKNKAISCNKKIEISKVKYNKDIGYFTYNIIGSLLSEGGIFQIGRHGKITVIFTCGLYDKKEHYAYMLEGHVKNKNYNQLKNEVKNS